MTAQAANVEWLTLTGSTSINGTGNDGVNKITGNTGANILDGGGFDGDADTLVGGTGNDIYIVWDATDVVTELAGQGTDEVRTDLVSFSLALKGANVENLTLTGTAGQTGIGNSLANVITGSSASDTLTGGLGNDSFVFNTALDGDLNVDTITDFNVLNDQFRLEKDIFTDIPSFLSTLATYMFVNGTEATTADHRIIYNAATGNVWYDVDGMDGAEAILFANVSNHAVLTAADFSLI